jgi:hypothetical protein
MAAPRKYSDELRERTKAMAGMPERWLNFAGAMKRADSLVLVRRPWLIRSRLGAAASRWSAPGASAGHGMA